MEQFAITARRRDTIGTGPARQNRRDGLVPGVVYGHRADPVSILVELKELQAFLKHHGSVATLHIEGETEDATMGALLKETQRDPISREILCVDFLRVSLTELVEVEVPIHLTGEAPGVKIDGGTLEQSLHGISVSCLPHMIPEFIAADISELQTGHSLHVRDVVAPDGITFITSGDEAVASITKGIKAEDLEVHAEETAVPVEEEAEGE
jgi:large subunit ribosomal protein L25